MLQYVLKLGLVFYGRNIEVSGKLLHILCGCTSGVFSWGRIAGCIMRVFCGIVEVIIHCFVVFGYRLYGCMAVWLYLDTVCMVV